MNRAQGAVIGVAMALAGAVLAFALADRDAVQIGIRLRPLGAVLLGAGAVLLAAIWVAGMEGSERSAGNGDANGIRAVGGLIAVVTGITAVTALSIVTLTRLGGATNKDSIVAVSTSAFGIISAVTGAYLGIKISADQSRSSKEAAGEGAGAKRDAQQAQLHADALSESVERNLAPEQVKRVKAEAFEAVQEAARKPDPAEGGSA
jgi:hypothetical protein